MRDFRDAKAMARTLRDLLTAKSVSLTHTESLELVAKMLGFHDWNELSAMIQSEIRPEVAKPTTIIPAPATPSIAARGDLPAIALRDVVLFPQMIVKLFVGRDTTKRAIERAVAQDRRVLAITQRHSGDDNPRRADLYDVGVTASVIDPINRGDGTIKLLVRGRKRVAVVRLVEGPYLSAEIAPFEESGGKDEEAIALSRTVLERFKAVFKINWEAALASSRPGEPRVRTLLERAKALQKIGFLPNRLSDMAAVVDEPSLLADAIAPLLSCEISQKQELLETGDVATRLQKILALMKKDQQAA
jgi:ATP-dependent Lon protease